MLRDPWRESSMGKFEGGAMIRLLLSGSTSSDGTSREVLSTARDDCECTPTVAGTTIVSQVRWQNVLARRKCDEMTYSEKSQNTVRQVLELLCSLTFSRLIASSK
mmetsp:Transcript_10644/g.13458  ORF Transcript_10644/g.13458 Transcript_10644/m.13458 type:complete len:105 (-) Transcript_10644:20-334(-)